MEPKAECPLNYPSLTDALPCFRELARLANNPSDIAAEKAHAAKHFWCAQGAVQGMLLGDPADDHPTFGAGLEEEQTTEEAAAVLESVGSASEDPDVMHAIAWPLVAKALLKIGKLIFDQLVT